MGPVGPRWLALLCLQLAMVGAVPALGNVFTVTHAGDIGAGSLRAAIESANANPGLDTIEFSIPGDAPHLIAPSTALPEITDPLLIDGFSQSGGAAVEIVLSGTFAGSGRGLKIASGGVVVRGLSVVNWPNGITVQESSALGAPIGEIALVGNLFGVWPDLSPSGNSVGVTILCALSDLRIGGTSVGQGNTFGYNWGGGIIVAQECDGIGIEIVGNAIGTDSFGSSVLPNGGGIFLPLAQGVEIGDGTPAGSNRIAFNRLGGVLVGETATGVSILNNRIHSNGGLAIDLGGFLDEEGITENDAAPDGDSGANDLQNFPLLSAAAPDGLGGTNLHVALDSVPDSDFIIEIYANSKPDGTLDPVHVWHGEAELLATVLDPVQTDANGHWEGQVVVPGVGPFLSATATHEGTGNTSELSPFVPVIADSIAATSCTAAALIEAAAACGETDPEQLCEVQAAAGCSSVEGTEPLVFFDRTFFDGSNVPGGRFLYSCPTCFNGVVLLGDGIAVRHLDAQAAAFSDAVLVSGAGVHCQGCRVLGCDAGFSIFNSEDVALNGVQAESCTYGAIVADGTRRLGVGGSSLGGEFGIAINNVQDARVELSYFSSCGSCVEIGQSGGSAPSLAAPPASTAGVELRRNDFPLVAHLAIDLAPLGPTANDAGDGDDGPNALQNHPTIAAATVVGDELRVTVELDSEPQREFEVDLLASDVCGADDRGLGIHFGTVALATDGTGHGSAMATFALPLSGVASFSYVAGIATSEEGNSSEVGTCTATSEAPADIFSDDFESGNLSAWSTAVP